MFGESPVCIIIFNHDFNAYWMHIMTIKILYYNKACIM